MVLLLKNGDRIVAKIIKWGSTHHTIKPKYGAVIKIPIKSIKEILKPGSDYGVFILYNNTTVRGYKEKEDFEKFIIISGPKKIVIYKNKIKHTDWTQKPKPYVNQDPKIIKVIPKIIKNTNNVPLNSMWRSALLPSWGQFYQGKSTKGWIIAALQGASIIGIILSYQKYQSYLDEWNSTSFRTKELHDKISSMANTVDLLKIAAVSIWALNIVDAGIFAPDSLKKNGKRLSYTITPSLSYALIFELRF